MEIHIEKLLLDENVTYITKHYKQVSFTSPRHFHNEYEIAYIENGHGKLFVGNNIVNFNFILILKNPGQPGAGFR